MTEQDAILVAKAHALHDAAWLHKQDMDKTLAKASSKIQYSMNDAIDYVLTHAALGVKTRHGITLDNKTNGGYEYKAVQALVYQMAAEEAAREVKKAEIAMYNAANKQDTPRPIAVYGKGQALSPTELQAIKEGRARRED